jgi:hypothetical protein
MLLAEGQTWESFARQGQCASKDNVDTLRADHRGKQGGHLAPGAGGGFGNSARISGTPGAMSQSYSYRFPPQFSICCCRCHICTFYQPMRN